MVGAIYKFLKFKQFTYVQSITCDDSLKMRKFDINSDQRYARGEIRTTGQ